MKKRFWIFVFVSLIVSAFTPVYGVEDEKEDSENPVKLGQITVSAHKDALAKDIVAEDLIQTPSMSGSVLDTLGNEAGVQLRRSALAGSDGSSLRLRGFDETRLRITQDGVSLNRDGSYGNGPVDWSIFSGDRIEKIEIYRGAGPAKYGNTLGGVVNIVTRKPSEVPTTELRSSAGSLSTWDSSIHHAWKVGLVGWSLSAGHFESDGYLRNNTMDRNNFSALFTVDLPSNWQVGAGMDYSIKEIGMGVYNQPDSPYYDSDDPDADERTYGGPGIGGRLINGVYAWGDGSKAEDENLNLTAFVQKNLAKGKFRTDFRLWNQDRTETYVDATNDDKVIYERETNAEDNNWLLQAQGDYKIGNHLIEVGGETKTYGWGPQDVAYIDTSYFNGSINFFEFISQGFKDQNGIMQYHALFTQDTWTPSSTFSVEFGLRQEWFSADSVDPEAFGYEWETDVTDMSETALDPRLAVTYSPWSSGALCARFGITHRYPTSPEYFWWYLNNGSGYFNTEFNPEQAMQYELSFSQTLVDHLDIVIRGYYYDVEDYISSTMVSGVGSVYYNIGQVDIEGLEIGVSAGLLPSLKLWTNVTLQRGDKSDDPWDTNNELSNQLADFPETMANAGLDFSLNRFRSRLWVNYVGDREHLSSGTLVTLDSYTLVNACVACKLYESKKMSLDFELAGQNLLDEDYEEEDGYPMPGATFMAGARLSF